jgi:Ni,Fe-hydrogenase I cytochrome b subunit
MLHPMSAKVIATILLILALLVTASALYYMKSQYKLAALQQRIAELAHKGSQEGKQTILPVTGTPRPQTEIARK